MYPHTRFDMHRGHAGQQAAPPTLSDSRHPPCRPGVSTGEMWPITYYNKGKFGLSIEEGRKEVGIESGVRKGNTRR